MPAEKTKKILIVEDEQPVARALQLKLNRRGFEATVASDGETAMEELKNNVFDLIILDLIMPRMNGFTTLAELKARKISAPIVVVSNLGQEADIERAKSLGAREYFIKSNTPIANLVDKIAQMLA